MQAVCGLGARCPGGLRKASGAVESGSRGDDSMDLTRARLTAADLRRLARWLTMEEPGLRGAIDRAVETALAVVASEGASLTVGMRARR